MITGLNHITYTVSDLSQSIAFYRELVGLKLEVNWKSGAYLSAGELWVCLSQGEPKPANDYTHTAFSVSEDKFESLASSIIASGATIWQDNVSEGNSLYFLDPDGHKLEIHCGNLADRLEHLKSRPYQDLIWHS